MVGGVCGGLAEYSGMDPLLWRIGFVALTLTIGVGVPAYLLLWLFLPADGAPRSPGRVRRPRARRPDGPRSPVARITVAFVLIVEGVLVMLDRFTGLHPGPRGYIGAALLVVGLGLIAAAFAHGRTARGGLIAIGILLSIALSVASVPERNWHVNVNGGVGSHTYRPLTAAEVHSTYDAGIGLTRVDLSAVDLNGLSTPIRTTVDGGVGKLVVLVPQSADVQVTVDQGIGRVDIFGDGPSDGYYRGTGSASWTGDDHPEFVINIDAGVGDVEVSRA